MTDKNRSDALRAEIAADDVEAWKRYMEHRLQVYGKKSYEPDPKPVPKKKGKKGK